MINFCHISPTSYLSTFCEKQTHHLLLAHLVEHDADYRHWYSTYRGRVQTGGIQYDSRGYPVKQRVFILDNSAFEMFKQGRPMYPSDQLVEMGRAVEADYIVMSDYPGEHSSKTIQAATKLAPEFRKHGFGTFFVPQSCVGDIEDYIGCFAWAASSPLVDYIGVSILGVPNAYGVEKGNNLQRFFSRWRMMEELESRGILKMAKENGKKIHFLGMVDGPNEISLVSRFHIDTWDSSAAVWCGLNGIKFDNSPTGLINGKFEKEVDFGIVDTTIDTSIVEYNIKYINNLIKSAGKKE